MKKYQNTTNIKSFVKKVKTYLHKKTEENLFFEQRIKDHKTIMQMLPSTIMFHLNDERKRYVMSKLLVFGPSSFPLLVTRSGAIVMAGAYYGRGRVVALPHEHILSNQNLMLGEYGE